MHNNAVRTNLSVYYKPSHNDRGHVFRYQRITFENLFSICTPGVWIFKNAYHVFLEYAYPVGISSP